ncbi:glyoxylase-like metal-dependent hydrolase (beta-lactamase superfamily II) [Mobilisporobacter senegalensis]|uniref:Glyoxylase-like metal-dependent hydrolase (Beta-lactamase superfamily II) n=1 Tax=Mobilisporobacter senegalensis TaxID=1329262 RepID=A0A3N1XAW8_9FIRM|nr:MBL fold metallo-hydrolase [Mobilisporobacter senegalensis]ROR22112.1 glyoxylase-like metal-dependent hydrolase (beta-lactamase superfamily II) [Mobilisporobacter senegalensis]
MADIIVLNIKFNFNGGEDVIHPVVLKDDKNMVLVDCGYTGFLPMIENAMKEENLDCNQLTHVIITHHDHDHMGALSELKKTYPNVKVVSSEVEEPYISGKLKSLRLEQAEELYLHMTEEEKPFGEAFCDMLKKVEPVKVDLIVHDGDHFEWCNGCTIIGTPGHSPGHISLYVENEETIITGDAAAIENNNLLIPNPEFTLDMNRAIKSLDHIREINAKTIICYHGGVLLREG